MKILKHFFAPFQDWGKSNKFCRQYLDKYGAILNNNRIKQTTLESISVPNYYKWKAYDEALKYYLYE